MKYYKTPFPKNQITYSLTPKTFKMTIKQLRKMNMMSIFILVLMLMFLEAVYKRLLQDCANVDLAQERCISFPVTCHKPESNGIKIGLSDSLPGG